MDLGGVAAKHINWLEGRQFLGWHNAIAEVDGDDG